MGTQHKCAPTVSLHQSEQLRSAHHGLATTPHDRSASASDSAARSQARIEIAGLTKRFLTPKGDAFTALPTSRSPWSRASSARWSARPAAASRRRWAWCPGWTAQRGLRAGQRPRGPRHHPGISFMFQADALLPWKTVLGNV